MITTKTFTTMKHDVVFDVANLGEDDINNFCINEYNDGEWEEHTFIIFDKFKDKTKVMIDMGGWIGITPLYCSQKFKHVVAFECDREAIHRFKENLSVNPSIKNISISDNAIWDYNGKTDFGAKQGGEFGDSESSMLFCHQQNAIQVFTTTFLNAMNYYKVNLKEIGFIKMDIEGAEQVVVSDMQRYLSAYKPVLYLSLHHHILPKKDVAKMLDVLFDIYSDVKVYNKMGHSFQVDKRRIIDNKLEDCVFEK